MSYYNKLPQYLYHGSFLGDRNKSWSGNTPRYNTRAGVGPGSLSRSVTSSGHGHRYIHWYDHKSLTGKSGV
jgi:hypothetical protein